MVTYSNTLENTSITDTMQPDLVEAPGIVFLSEYIKFTYIILSSRSFPITDPPAWTLVVVTGVVSGDIGNGSNEVGETDGLISDETFDSGGMKLTRKILMKVKVFLDDVIVGDMEP